MPVLWTEVHRLAPSGKQRANGEIHKRRLSEVLAVKASMSLRDRCRAVAGKFPLSVSKERAGRFPSYPLDNNGNWAGRQTRPVTCGLRRTQHRIEVRLEELTKAVLVAVETANFARSG